MALLCGSTSVIPFLSHKNVVLTTASYKSSFVAFQLPLPKLTLSSSVRTLLPQTSPVRSQQDSTAVVAGDPRFVCGEPEPRFKGSGLSTVAVTSRLCCNSQNPSSRRRISVRCKAVGENRQVSLDETIIYKGIYGPWTVDDTDVREVILYRSGLVTAAASFVVAASVAFLPDNLSLSAALKQNVDLFYVLGSVGLGLSLFLIHIYVTEIKRALQALWGLGVLGSATTYFVLAQPSNKNLIEYVIDNPSAVWLVGPLFAALTGLVFKEGLCYGKLEAGLLTFVIPIVLLGHLTGLMDDGVKLTLLASWMTLFVIFAGRKFTQPIKDDIGDKSVFMFNSLRDDERKALLEKLEQQKTQN